MKVNLRGLGAKTDLRGRGCERESERKQTRLTSFQSMPLHCKTIEVRAASILPHVQSTLDNKTRPTSANDLPATSGAMIRSW